MAARQSASTTDRSLHAVEGGTRAVAGSPEDLPAGHAGPALGDVRRTGWSRSTYSPASPGVGCVVEVSSYAVAAMGGDGRSSMAVRPITIVATPSAPTLWRCRWPQRMRLSCHNLRQTRSAPGGVGGGPHTSRAAAHDARSRRRQAAADADGQAKEARPRIGSVDGRRSPAGDHSRRWSRPSRRPNGRPNTLTPSWRDSMVGTA